MHASENGVLTWSELRPHVTRLELAEALATPYVRKHGRGTYRLAAARPDYGTARRLRGTVSHLSAVLHWRLDTLTDLTAIYVTVPRNRSRVDEPDTIRVFYRNVPANQQVGGVTTVARTLLDCLRDCPLPEALAAADSAIRRGRVTKLELVEMAAALRGPGSGRARRLVEHVDALAASAMESALRGVLVEAGIDGFEPQFAVGKAHADLGHAEARVLIEADSFQYHGMTKDDLIHDCERYDEFAAAGYVVLRFTWWHIMERRKWLVDTVRRTVAERRN